MSLFPKRPPRVMHGLAGMLGAHKAGGLVPPLPVVSAAHAASRISDTEAAAALDALLARLAKAERQVALTRHYLTGVAAQAQKLPAGHVARVVTDLLVKTLSEALDKEQQA